jgi:hypothetical protein
MKTLTCPGPRDDAAGLLSTTSPLAGGAHAAIVSAASATVIRARILTALLLPPTSRREW